MSFVDHQTHNGTGWAGTPIGVVVEDLWGKEEHSLLPPILSPGCRGHVAGHHGGVSFGYPHYIVTRMHLLLHQRLGGGHEDDLAAREPSVGVIHHHRCDEGLS